jgi:hypothetical protein
MRIFPGKTASRSVILSLYINGAPGINRLGWICYPSIAGMSRFLSFSIYTRRIRPVVSTVLLSKPWDINKEEQNRGTTLEAPPVKEM